MAFKYNSTGVKMDGGTVAPEGNYNLIVREALDTKDGLPRVTKNGDPMVNVKCEIVDGEYAGTTVWHNVTFMPAEKKGAGMAVHFLKNIGEPWEGEFEVRAEDWEGKMFRAHLKVEKDLKGRPRNQVAYLLDDEKESDVPF